MALEPRDLVFPRGVVKASQYPNESVDALLQVWLEQAKELAPENEKAQQAYVLQRHYALQAERYAEEYTSWSEGGISRSRSQASIAHFQRLAGAQQALFERETGVTLPRKQASSGTTEIEASF